jgi:hypothetical protein
MLGKTCGVRMFKGPCECSLGCADCRIGCFAPARHRNPFYGTDFHSEFCWWRGGYNYAEFLCAEHYDMVAAKEWEEAFRGEEGYEEGYEEDPEYTRILETL